MNIQDWLKEIGLEQYVDLFNQNNIDENTLLALSEDNLKELGIESLGHRKQIMEAISKIKGSQSSGMNPAGKGALIGFLVAAGGMMLFMSTVTSFTFAGKAIWVILAGIIVSIPGAIIGAAAGRSR